MHAVNGSPKLTVREFPLGSIAHAQFTVVLITCDHVQQTVGEWQSANLREWRMYYVTCYLIVAYQLSFTFNLQITFFLEHCKYQPFHFSIQCL